MNLAFLLSVQAAAAPAPAPATPVHASDFDLARYRKSAPPPDVHSLFPRDNSSNAEIVVCARRAGPAYPIEEMAGSSRPSRSRRRPASATARRRTSMSRISNFPTGSISHRAMVGIKLPF